jgi:hypothetical protein
LDEENLVGGQLWRQEIPKALRASDFILIFLSQTSIRKIGYVQNEFKLAIDAWKQIPEGMIHTVPVRLDNCDVPEQFKEFHWVDLFDERGFERLLRAIRTGLKQRQPSGPASRSAPPHDATGTAANRESTTAPLNTATISVATALPPLDKIGTVGAIDTRLGNLFPLQPETQKISVDGSHLKLSRDGNATS